MVHIAAEDWLRVAADGRSGGRCAMVHIAAEDWLRVAADGRSGGRCAMVHIAAEDRLRVAADGARRSLCWKRSGADGNRLASGRYIPGGQAAEADGGWSRGRVRSEEPGNRGHEPTFVSARRRPYGRGEALIFSLVRLGGRC